LATPSSGKRSKTRLYQLGRTGYSERLTLEQGQEILGYPLLRNLPTYTYFTIPNEYLLDIGARVEMR